MAAVQPAPALQAGANSLPPNVTQKQVQDVYAVSHSSLLRPYYHHHIFQPLLALIVALSPFESLIRPSELQAYAITKRISRRS
jgi:hypothetical protein